MKLVRVFGIVGAVALVTSAAATPAFAQSNNESFPQFQWNFSTPGARANAMGRAFIGIADDASAAVSNPAGLSRLSKRQVYFEFKATTVSNDRLASPDSLFTLIPTTFEKQTNAPSFITYSQPIGDKLAFSFAMHQFLNFQEEFHLDPRPIPNSFNVLRALDGKTNFKGQAYAISVAYAATKNLSVGVTLTFNRLSANERTSRFTTIFGDDANAFDVEASNVLINETSIDQSRTGAGVIVGLLYKANDKLSAGFQFTKAPNFVVPETLNVNLSGVAGGALTTATGFPKDVHINVPNRVGFGLSYRVMPRLLAAFDVVRINYSSLAKDFTIVFPNPDIASSEYSIKNATETHFGGEYLLLTGNTKVFARAGVFTSPDHATSYGGTNPGELAIYNSLPRTNAVIGTAGVGVAVGAKFQVDFAAVFNKEFVVSFAARF